MRAKVVAVVSNVDDRTADLTVEVYDDANVLIETDNIILPVDILSRDLANKRLIEHLNRVILARADFPYTDAELETMLLGMQTVVPE
jgi:hypothetical protein